ncbi:hypothetical protein [Mycobacterium sp. NAZ190054]|uniref:hypothetical protein n=1 Tax=Mycobacterium sp. NAZ190054 TaxID=1747766 RepID=UPI000797D48D|nr:hypothetical protein [Mycobacterium sp. NAZ190054]KWX66796.1 hypothetical protein ASJ79_05370 [Mycobacterium sp. NAZ190054]
MDLIESAAAKREQAPQDAHDQAVEHDSFFADDIYVAPNGEQFPVPVYEELDDDQQERLDAVQHMLNSCDRFPDVTIPGYTEETVDDDGKVTRRIHPERTAPGGYKMPYEKGGERVSPPANVQLTEALLGDEQFAKFKAAKGKSSVFVKMFMELQRRVQEREQSDPKSEGGSADVAEVSD